MTTPTVPPLPATADLKQYLRIETAQEDLLIADLLKEAVGLIESAIGKSLSTEVVAWRDDAASLRIGEVPTSLILGYVPIDASTVIVTDRDGTVVAASNYTVRQDKGLICGLGGDDWDGAFAFDNGPYIIACTAGYGTSATYATRELPMIRMGILDFAAFLFQQRTPGARAEGAAGTRVDYEIDGETGWPVRVARLIRKLRGPVFARP